MNAPELVRPIPSGAAPPAIPMPQPFMKGTPAESLRTPGPAVTGPVAAPPAQKTIPIEELLEIEKQKQATPAALAPPPSAFGSSSSMAGASGTAPAVAGGN